MKIEINNLTALIQGRYLNIYQRSLAVEEWHKLLNHVDEMEKALPNELLLQCYKEGFQAAVDSLVAANESVKNKTLK